MGSSEWWGEAGFKLVCEREREREREREKTGDDKHEKETYQKKKEDLLTFGGKII